MKTLEDLHVRARALRIDTEQRRRPPREMIAEARLLVEELRDVLREQRRAAGWEWTN